MFQNFNDDDQLMNDDNLNGGVAEELDEEEKEESEEEGEEKDEDETEDDEDSFIEEDNMDDFEYSDEN